VFSFASATAVVLLFKSGGNEVEMPAPSCSGIYMCEITPEGVSLSITSFKRVQCGVWRRPPLRLPERQDSEHGALSCLSGRCGGRRVACRRSATAGYEDCGFQPPVPARFHLVASIREIPSHIYYIPSRRNLSFIVYRSSGIESPVIKRTR
jgi:hypothetical protein